MSVAEIVLESEATSSYLGECECNGNSIVCKVRVRFARFQIHDDKKGFTLYCEDCDGTLVRITDIEGASKQVQWLEPLWNRQNKKPEEPTEDKEAEDQKKEVSNKKKKKKEGLCEGCETEGSCVDPETCPGEEASSEDDEDEKPAKKKQRSSSAPPDIPADPEPEIQSIVSMK